MDFCVFPSAVSLRKDKPLELRAIDEDAEASEPVILLANAETAAREKPVRLGPTIEDLMDHKRLDLPDRDENELRTHQPGIDAIIGPGQNDPELLEEGWGEQSAARNPIPWGWFALLGLTIFWAIIWSLSQLDETDEQTVLLRQEARSALVDDEKEELEAARLIDRIDQALRDYFRATSVGELADRVRFPERVLPLMRDYHADQPVFLGEVKAIKALQPLTLDNRGDFWRARVALAGGRQRDVLMQITGSGEVLIDWETLVCHQPMKWDDFALRRPAGTSLDFRVYVEPDFFYSHEFTDSSKWVCYRLTASDSDETLFGYVQAESQEAQVLRETIAQNGGGKTSLILRITVPEGIKSRRGVVIEKVLSHRWIYLDPPDSGS